MKVKHICDDLLELSKKIFSELGGGSPEHVVQNALAIELREARIPYLMEIKSEYPVKLELWSYDKREDLMKRRFPVSEADERPEPDPS